MEEKQTEISQLGEFGLIDRLTAGLEYNSPNTVKGVGDDAAAGATEVVGKELFQIHHGGVVFGGGLKN